MNHFPVSGSVLASNGLNTFLRETYAFSQQFSCRLLRAGLNHTYLYSYEWRSFQEIEEEQRLLPLLGTALHFFYLGVQCLRFENFSSVFLNDAYLKRYIQARVKKYVDFSVKAG